MYGQTYPPQSRQPFSPDETLLGLKSCNCSCSETVNKHPNLIALAIFLIENFGGLSDAPHACVRVSLCMAG